MGGGLAGRWPTLKPTMRGAIANHLQERFVANCSELKDCRSELGDRHCERSEAIHPSACEVTMDCFASLAMTWLPQNTPPHSRGAMHPRFCKSFRPKKRAQGMPGACCTRGLVCKMHSRMRTRAYRYSRSSPAFPARWSYGLCR